MEVLERFLHYVSFDTQSSDTSSTAPSTKKQLVLAQELVKEMNNLGLANVRLSRKGIVYATLPSNVKTHSPVIGLIAHMDTAMEMSGKDVKPRLIKSYDGKKIILNKSLGIVLDPTSFPSLLTNIGEDLIVTDGTTLLGGDDKAGIAIILTTVEFLLKNPEVKHGKIQIAITPDEEVGRGVENFDVKGFAADYAYTVDGGQADVINFENFNAASAVVTVNGVSIHPGYAKDKMVNAILVAYEFNELLPPKLRPSLTENYEGFNHLLGIQGNIEKTVMHYIIRNHDLEKLEQQKASFFEAANLINTRYGPKTLIVELKDGYRNMGPLISKEPTVLNRAFKSYENLGIKVTAHPIRGGTDGAVLAYRGLLTPNLGTGAYNGHGKFEYVSVNQMKQMVKIVTDIVTVK